MNTHVRSEFNSLTSQVEALQSEVAEIREWLQAALERISDLEQHKAEAEKVKPCTAHTSPIEYLPRAGWAEPEKASEYTVPGWYFWEENQAYCQGPYKTEHQAITACAEYARAL